MIDAPRGTQVRYDELERIANEILPIIDKENMNMDALNDVFTLVKNKLVLKVKDE